MTLALGWLPQPIGGMPVIQQSFFDSVFRFVTHDSQHRQLFTGYLYAANAYIPSGRNQLVQSFLETDADHLLMLDWDIAFTPEDVYAAVDAVKDEYDVIMGCYVTWFGDGGGLRPCWFVEKDGNEFTPAPEFEGGAIIPLSVCGMGFTLIHRDLFLRMEKASNDDPWAWFGHDIINRDRVGEDLTFSTRARRCGAKIWGHGGIQLGHTKTKTLYPGDIVNESVRWADNRQIVKDALAAKKILNVGGGSKSIPLPKQYDGWTHVLLDIKEAPGVDVVMDARGLVDSPEALRLGQFDVVYSSHNIEHYEMWDIPKVLAGMYRVLKPGGGIEVLCPNFEEVLDRIKAGAGLDDVAYEVPVGPIRYRDMLFGYEKQIEESGESYFMHKTAITPDFLRQQLEEAGFEGIEIETQGDGLELRATAVKPEKAL